MLMDCEVALIMLPPEEAQPGLALPATVGGVPADVLTH